MCSASWMRYSHWLLALALALLPDVAFAQRSGGGRSAAPVGRSSARSGGGSVSRSSGAERSYTPRSVAPSRSYSAPSRSYAAPSSGASSAPRMSSTPRVTTGNPRSSYYSRGSAAPTAPTARSSAPAVRSSTTPRSSFGRPAGTDGRSYGRPDTSSTIGRPSGSAIGRPSGGDPATTSPRAGYRADRGGDGRDPGGTAGHAPTGQGYSRTGQGYAPTGQGAARPGMGRGPVRPSTDERRGGGFGWSDRGPRGDRPGSPRDFRGDRFDGRYGHDYHVGVIRPYHAGLRIGYRRPVFFHGERVVACVPSYGFGFFTPVTAVAYPVYPVPIYEPPVVVGPGYYDPGYAVAPPPEYYGEGYAEQAPMAGVAGQPPMQAPPPDYGPAEPEAAPPADQPAPQPGDQPQTAPNTQPGAQQAAQNDPRLQEAQKQMSDGMAAFNAGKYEEAGRMFLRVGLADERNIDAWLGYAVARFATGNYEPAAMAVRRAIRAFPDAVNSPVDIRGPYAQAGDFDRQAAALEDFVRANPDNGDAWLVLGFIRHFSGQRELATKTFDVVNRRFERDRDLADIFLKAKSPEEIEREATPSPQAAPRDTQPSAGQPATPDESGAAPLTAEPQVAPPAPEPQADPAAPPPPVEEEDDQG